MEAAANPIIKNNACESTKEMIDNKPDTIQSAVKGDIIINHDFKDLKEALKDNVEKKS